MSRDDMSNEKNAVDRLHPETENEKYWRERGEYADTHDDGSDDPWSTPH